jgi:hypothetical protein
MKDLPKCALNLQEQAAVRLGLADWLVLVLAAFLLGWKLPRFLLHRLQRHTEPSLAKRL